MKRYFIILNFIPFFVFAANIENTCWDENNSNNFYVTFTGGKFTSNKKGATATLTYKGVPAYNILCNINYPSGDKFFYYHNQQTRTNLLPSEAGGHYLKVNDDFDISIWHTTSMDVPSTAVNSSGQDERAWIKNYTGMNILKTKFGSDSTNPYIQIRLRRDQIGGVLHIPGGIQLFRTYDDVFSGYATGKISNNTPTMTVSTTDHYLPLPVMCKINNNSVINVDFGDIDNTRITQDGSYYIKKIPLKYSCNAAINQNIDIHVVASPTSFSSDLIATSIPDSVGILLKYNDAVIKPNGKFSTILINGMGQDEIQVAPVINDPKKSVTGDFTASATLVMTMI